MDQRILKKLPPRGTMAILETGKTYCTVVAKKALSDEYIEDRIMLDGEIRTADGIMTVPAAFFDRVMGAYVYMEGREVTIERSGLVVHTCSPEGKQGYVEMNEVIPQLHVEYFWQEEAAHLEVILDMLTMGPRELTPAEQALPYAKYYNHYWETPYHLRPDAIAWSKKAHLFQLGGMKEPEEMLHIKDVRNLLDADFRKNIWQEGWTLFPDGSGVMCTKTEFPGTTSEMFSWWFAWHVMEDIRYMLWYPPSHYGIHPTYELKKKLKDPNLSLFEKTHGSNSVHLVYESTQIDAISRVAAKPVKYSPIPFHDPTRRGFTKEDYAVMEEKGCAAICGGNRMLHFFAENEDKTGGTLYSHFWYGLVQDENMKWHGPGNGKDESLITMILNIGQHATKEFANLASILPALYSEEGKKPF